MYKDKFNFQKKVIKIPKVRFIKSDSWKTETTVWSFKSLEVSQTLVREFRRIDWSDVLS
jgi:hypothetical protein